MNSQATLLNITALLQFQLLRLLKLRLTTANRAQRIRTERTVLMLLTSKTETTFASTALILKMALKALTQMLQATLPLSNSTSIPSAHLLLQLSTLTAAAHGIAGRLYPRIFQQLLASTSFILYSRVETDICLTLIISFSEEKVLSSAEIF